MDGWPNPEGAPLEPRSVFSGQTASGAPSPIPLGTLGGLPSDAKPNPFDHTTHPMLQGDVTSAGHGTLGAANPFRWKQFWLGLILPVVVVGSMSVVATLVEDNRWDNMYHEETLSLSPDENGHFQEPFEIQEGHAMEWCWFNTASSEEEPQIYCDVEYRQNTNSISIMQEMEFTPTIHSIQLNLVEENGTFSLSFNGSFRPNPYVYGSIYSESGDFLASLETNDLVRGNTSYLNATFAPQNESASIYIYIEFDGINERLEVFLCDEYPNGCPNEQDNHSVILSSSSWRSGEKIGEYSPDNGTLWFVPNGTFNQTFLLSLETYDEASQMQNSFQSEAVNASFCCMPLVYIGAIIMAFVRGNKGLGWGLISSGAVSVLLLVALLAMLIAAFSGGF